MNPSSQPFLRAMPLVLLTLLVACRAPAPSLPPASATPQPAAQPTSTTEPTLPPRLVMATPVPTPVLLVPQQPSDLGPAPSGVTGVIDAIAAALDERPDDIDGLLARLQAWQALGGGERPYREADLDGDGIPEGLLLVTAPPEPMRLMGPGALVVLRHGDGYSIADSRTYETISQLALPQVRDLTGDGRAEVALTYQECGAHTCFLYVQVYAYDGGRLRELLAEPATMSYAELKIEDVNGDGGWEIVLHGGSIGSVGAGPVQTYTDTYAYDGRAYVLAQREYDPSTVRVHVLYDGDRALRRGDLQAAVASYQRVISDASLGNAGFMSPEDERRALEAWAGYRLITALAALGEHTAAGQALDALHAGSAGHPCMPLAEAFWQAYESQGSLAAGCVAATAYAQTHAEVLESFGQYGYGNPAYTLEDVCPLR